MKLLLDTHIFLWYVSGSRRLPAALRDRIRNPDDEVYLSVRLLISQAIEHDLTIATVDESMRAYPVALFPAG